ncbi:hypothetical protein B6A10_09335 [Flavobacterium sp. L1I52]|uniref:Protein NO VEIN C-terminal domain-containing protein n=1 Tax=Flavobacterium pokkalii TaxID=1940408 RepID=A0ABR7URG4_9FLAO|nr:DUF3883 domain-containing protein [Flavobacterium pokkalii]MBD0725380.1 hypothetical protein [Flavobacterium pokkalii]
MLNEKIETCSEIADLNGLYFIWKNLIAGVSSINSLTNLRLHHKGKINLNIDFTLLLFEQLNIVYLESDKIQLCNPEIKNLNFDLYSYQDWFSKTLLDFLIKENVISLSEIKYESQIDKYVLPRFNIKYKYACYRNLLISLSIIEKSNEGNFYIGDLLINYIISENKVKRKITEAELLKKLEEQRSLGETGELFVINYETQRLSSRNDTNKIKRISLMDVTAGYDIISFNDDYSNSLDRFIEVKTFKGKPHFHWSSNEIQTAKIKSKNYHLYLIDATKITDTSYTPLIIYDPVSYFEKSNEWISSPDSFLFEKINI